MSTTNEWNGSPADPISLEQMRSRGGTWAAYRNMAMDSFNAGHWQFMRVGEGCTYVTPPPRYPDTAMGPGWKYRLMGMLDLKTGLLVMTKEEPT